MEPALCPESLPLFQAAVPMSGQQGEGVSQVKDKLRSLLDSLADQATSGTAPDGSFQEGIPSAFQEHARKTLL